MQVYIVIGRGSQATYYAVFKSRGQAEAYISRIDGQKFFYIVTDQIREFDSE